VTHDSFPQKLPIEEKSSSIMPWLKKQKGRIISTRLTKATYYSSP